MWADDSDGGTDDATVVVEVTDVDEPPDAPATATFPESDKRPTRLTVSWTALANAGPPDITRYTLRYGTGGGTWTERSLTGNLPITSYEVKYTPPSRGLHGRGSTSQRYSLIRNRVLSWRGPIHPNSTSDTLIHLDPNRAYQVSVRAVNAAGASEWTGP